MIEYQRVWQAVIVQALQDATSQSYKSEARYEKRKAKQWLLGGSNDFTIVCENAGYDPVYIRNEVTKFLKGETSVKRNKYNGTLRRI